MAKGVFFHTTMDTSIDKFMQFKKEYDIVKELQGLSSFGWDSTVCTITAELDIWDTYIKVCTVYFLHNAHVYVFTESESFKSKVS